MKEVIYTIPINDAYDVKCGCPLCRIEKKLDSESVEYIMGAAMMEPDIRIETNRLGFCPEHFSKMLEAKNRLSLGLMLQSYLAELLENAVPEKTSFMTKKKFSELSGNLFSATHNCFVCSRIAEKLDMYIRNIVFLWQREEEFREKTRQQEYFCPRHLSMLMEQARKSLPKRLLGKFSADHFIGTRHVLSSLSEDVTKFCNSYNYMFRDVPIGDAKLSVERTIGFLTKGEDKL